ncbi:cardiolipin synthase [Austwickia chelonae]|uniref:Putative cardiolipin synthase n=1 Tax=Austwickia chelonae NBRC 105200 TaxID=1184607 RepID=K6VSR0_9MICO|nr:phospholipase D-like domain-containing protein [Austwickia chelonae]GAB78380.1 putative cardiolipin synthase [Austwickia chelonae NBRC 105200]SEW02422.1 cardiolipin synthase [Austwickia chelonae]
MSRPHLPSRAAVLRAGLWTLGVGAAAQTAAVAAVLAVDAVRKRREPPLGIFPRSSPTTTRIAGAEVTTYTYGEDVYADMLAAIESAREHIFLETFIWKNDAIGEKFKEALIAAADRGVEVFVIYDGFANLVVDPRFFRFPDHVHVLRFPAVRAGMLMFNLRYFGRDHRKILVVDRRVGFVGGYNIGDLYATTWRDTHLCVTGPAVWEIENTFVDFWNEYRDPEHPEIPDRGAGEWEARIRASRNAPNRMLFPVRGLYLEAIDRAAERIYITQAYFLPDREILAALLAAARRGVDVRILMPEYSNHIVADWVARGYFTTLLKGGVTIWLYQDAMVHAKTATVDGRWSTVGTANIDRLSLLGNYEVNLELFSDEQAAHMEEIFARDLTNCRQLHLDDWQARGVMARIGERALANMQPLL